jgi:hypothetical protein
VACAQRSCLSNQFYNSHPLTLTYPPTWPQVLPGNGALLVADGDNYAIRKVCVYAVLRKLPCTCHGTVTHFLTTGGPDYL